MRYRWILVVIAALVLPPVVKAQHGGSGPAAVSRTAPREASQFNFLLGQWELTVKPAAVTLGQKIHGMPRLSGTWKAWRAMDGWGIEDELKIIDGSGNPMTLSHAVRLYDASAKKWKTSTADPYRGVMNTAEAEWSQSQMLTSSRGTDSDGNAYLSRARYTDIKRDSFRFIQERSTDNGKTWKENLTIEARRVSATAAR